MIKLINQINGSTCTQACIAMASGKTIEEVIEAVGSKALTIQEEVSFYIQNEIEFNQLLYTTMFNGLYAVTVPSLNLKNEFHRILVRCFNGDILEILDPNDGRDGKKFYDQVSFLNSTWGEVIQLG